MTTESLESYQNAERSMYINEDQSVSESVVSGGTGRPRLGSSGTRYCQFKVHRRVLVLAATGRSRLVAPTQASPKRVRECWL